MKTNGEQKKPDSYLLYSSIQMKFKYRQNSSMMRVIRMVSSGAGIDQKGIQKNLLGFWNSFPSISRSKLIDPQTLKICAFPCSSVKIKTFIQNTFIVYIFQQFYSVFSKTFQGAESDFSEIQAFFSHTLLLSHRFGSLPQKIQFPIQVSQSPVFDFSFLFFFFFVLLICIL